MPINVRRDAAGNPLISIRSFSADEIRRLSGDADAEPTIYQDNEGPVMISSTAKDLISQLHDCLYEVRRDAGLEIQRQRDRTSQMAICAAIGWSAAFWLAVCWWLS